MILGSSSEPHTSATFYWFLCLSHYLPALRPVEPSHMAQLAFSSPAYVDVTPQLNFQRGSDRELQRLGDAGTDASVSRNLCDTQRRNAYDTELLFDASLFSRNRGRCAFQTVHVHATLSMTSAFLFAFMLSFPPTVTQSKATVSTALAVTSLKGNCLSPICICRVRKHVSTSANAG